MSQLRAVRDLDRAVREDPGLEAHLLKYDSVEDRWAVSVFPIGSVAHHNILGGLLAAADREPDAKHRLRSFVTQDGGALVVLVLETSEGPEPTDEDYDNLFAALAGWQDEPKVPSLAFLTSLRSGGRDSLVCVRVFPRRTRPPIETVDFDERVLEDTPWPLKQMALSLIERRTGFKLEPVPPLEDQPPEEVYSRFDELSSQIQEVLTVYIGAFQEYLQRLQGRNFGSLEANRRVATIIQAVADQLQVTFACEKCGNPARFRCSATATSKTGMFVFSHSKGTHGGGTKIPELKVVRMAKEEKSEESV